MTPDASTWPAAWLTVVYKKYPNAERIPLLKDGLREIPLGDAIAARTTGRDFSVQPLSLRSISALLLFGSGQQSHMPTSSVTGRAQPSAGGLYPIEVYLVNFVGGEVPTGVFHYNVRDHALETIERRTFSAEDRAQLFVESSSPYAAARFAHDASCAIILTAAFDRSQNKYGERGYRYCLLEAGHIGQNIALVAASLDLACAPLGGVVDAAFERVVRVDGDEESLVYALIVGPRAA